MSTIYTALTDRLKTTSTLPVFIDQNEVVPTTRQVWCRATLLPAEPSPGSIGANGFDWENGLYQVDIFTPLGDTPSTVSLDIISTFPRALRLSVVGFDNTLEVQRCWLSSTRQDVVWHIQSVMVRWQLARNLGA